MGLIEWSEKKIRKLTIWDFALIKIVLVLFGIVIGAYFSTFVRAHVWHFCSVFIVLYAVLIYRVFKK
ncbi:MAG: hypothetical protein DRN66_02270 [Candidatus Nanohalarchaeota archaeon]|nr:MAG: hypothetical protein DRN66_02270 [Candidatus Nanohaloarchaeota archaeon]